MVDRGLDQWVLVDIQSFFGLLRYLVVVDCGFGGLL